MKEFLTKRWKKTTLNHFLKHLEEQCTNAGKCVREDRELLVQQQTSATSMTLFWAKKRFPDASNIATDCQNNRYPSFISCPYNSRRLMSSSVWKNDACRSCPKPKQIVSTVSIKLTQAGTVFHQNSQLHMWTSETHCLFCVPQIANINQYLLKSFENLTGVRFFNHSVEDRLYWLLSMIGHETAGMTTCENFLLPSSRKTWKHSLTALRSSFSRSVT